MHTSNLIDYLDCWKVVYSRVDLFMVQILDAGCGDRPQGTVNLDRHKGKSEHLQGYRGKVKPKETSNFVQGVIQHLPFKKGVFDLVLCHHTLEHLDNPEEAIKELCRVSRSQVEIVVPFRYHEIIQNWFWPTRKRWMQKHHKWNFTKNMLNSLFKSFKGKIEIHYRYKVLSLAKDNKYYHLNFKQMLLYGFLDTVFPPTPSELVVTARKRMDKPIIREQ